MLGKGERKADSSVQQNSVLKYARMCEFQKPQKDLIVLFIGMIAFKIASDAGYFWLTTQDSLHFRINFSPLKYVFGLLCCIVMFFFIRHDQRKASTFFLYFVFLFQMVPITSVYAFANESTIFYSVLCVSYLLCILVAGYTTDASKVYRNPIVSKTMMLGCGAIMLMIVAVIVLRYGAPSLAALNIYDVYELRSSGAFTLGRYENYLFTWTTAVILPVGIAWCITKRKFILMGILSGIMLMLYLYSGNKTFLFSIPLVIVCTFWSRRERFYNELFMLGCFGYLLLVILLWFFPVLQDVIQRVFSLLARRVMFVPANNKFLYFDYFSNHPLMGLGGIFPRWLIYIPNYYESIPYSYEISAIYYNQPEMNSNTGFLAEGYMRFGHMGTVLILLLFAFILKQIDRFQDRSGYQLAIGIFVYQIYSLSDAHLLDSLVLGPWMLLVLILLFCGSSSRQQQNNRLQIKQVRLFKHYERH